MTTDFAFDKVGKRMPYQVPDSFFAQLESNVMQEVKSEVAVTKKLRFRRITWGTIIGAAAAVALLVTVNLKSTKVNEYSAEAVNQAFSQLQPADQAYLLEVYDEDVFLNEQY